MQRSGIVSVAVTTLFLLSHAPLLAAERGPALLTVVGAISNTNRGVYRDFEDAFFKYHEKRFSKAFAFDRAALEAFAQTTITARAEGWPTAVTARGPLLRDVLDAAGVSADANITIFALDGYGGKVSATDRTAREWVLAIDVDGTPLGLGGRGPVWLLYDSGGKAISTEAEGQWIWSAFLITAE